MGEVLITCWQWDALPCLPSYHFLHDVSLMALRTFPGRAEEERRVQFAQGQRPFSIHLLPTIPALDGCVGVWLAVPILDTGNP